MAAQGRGCASILGQGWKSGLCQGTGSSSLLSPTAMLSPCPQEPGCGVQGASCQRWAPMARAAGTQLTDSGEHIGGTPGPGRAPQTPAHASWCRVDGCCAARMCTHHWLCPRTASLPQRHSTAARAAWGWQQLAHPQSPPVLGGKGGCVGHPRDPGGTESQCKTSVPDVHLQQREGSSRGIPLSHTHSGGPAHIPTEHLTAALSGIPGRQRAPGICQDLDLPEKNPFQAHLGSTAAPPQVLPAVPGLLAGSRAI